MKTRPALVPIVLATLVAQSACSLEQEADNLLSGEVDWKPVPGATMALASPGNDRYVTAAGQRGPSDSTPMDADGVFIIGSASKMVTAHLVLQLVDDGKLTLDETIDRWFADVPRADRITVRHLLRHQSGIPDYQHLDAIESDPLAPRTPEELVALAVAEPYTNDAPGTERADYSNTNYVLLARIVEMEGGVPWAQAVHERVAAPLGLTSLASVSERGVGDRLVRGLITTPGYEASTEGFALDPSLGFGAGGLVSNAADLLELTRAVRDGDLVSSELHEQLFDGVPFTIGEVAGTYGLGVMEVPLPPNMGGMRVRGHNGGLPGYSSMPVWDADSEAMVALLANASQGPDVDAVGTAVRALRIAVKHAQ